MSTLATILVLLVALLHAFFFVLEAFLWKTPYGRKTFQLERDFAEKSAALAQNQGLYNLFLTAGLIFGLTWGPWGVVSPVVTFFLACVVVAGAVGALTVNKRIFFIQAVPAIAALVVQRLV